MGLPSPAASVDHGFPACPLRSSLLLQLLVRLGAADDRPQLESPELYPADSQSDLSLSSLSFTPHRRCGHVASSAPGISARIFSFLPCSKTKRSALPTR